MNTIDPVSQSSEMGFFVLGYPDEALKMCDCRFWQSQVVITKATMAKE